MRVETKITPLGGKTFLNARKASERYIEQLRSKLMALDVQTLQYMVAFIGEHKLREDKPDSTANTGKLEEVLAVDQRIDTPEQFGWAIGEIEKLKKEAKHYASLNFGSDHIIGMKVPGEFSNGPSGDKTGAFYYMPGHGNWMTPSKGIKGINYIENTDQYLRDLVGQILSSLTLK